MGGETTTVARQDGFFTPQLNLSIAIVTENIYFPEIPRLSRLPVYIGALEIAWWCRDWIGIIRSWLTHAINILVTVCFGGCWLGLGGGSTTYLSTLPPILFFEVTK